VIDLVQIRRGVTARRISGTRTPRDTLGYDTPCCPHSAVWWLGSGPVRSERTTVTPYTRSI